MEMEMEMEMEMVAAGEIESIGEDLTPPLCPISYSLHDSFLDSHCASCFSPLSSNPNPNPFCSFDDDDDPRIHYCSLSCSSSHSHLHLSSAASHHLSNNPVIDGETSDLRVALLLLLHIKQRHQHLPSFKTYDDRIFGLMTNRHKLLHDHHDDDKFSSRIKKGARAMVAAATTLLRDSDGRSHDSDSNSDLSGEYLLLAEAVLCLVVTNAVEVQDRVGRSVGIAVYDISFSWINHSCSPNASYRFFPPDTHTHTHGVFGGRGQLYLITPAASSSSNGNGNGNCNGCHSTHSNFLTGWAWAEISGGPRIAVRSIKPLKKGEQVTIAYTDLLQPKELRQLELWSKYRFTCCCHRCVAVPLTYTDQRLQEICGSKSNVGVENLTDYIDDAIDDYLSSNDAESCCNKLEDSLLNGLLLLLHPQHHLSLKAYTTLGSAYKVRAAAMAEEDALKMNRFSAAYSLLLALATHHLFLSDSCLIVSVSNFWIGAGESLLNLATLVSNSDPKSCSRCRLIDVFQDDGQIIISGNNKVLDDISKDFLKCITNDITSKVWRFLVSGNAYLEAVKDFETTLLNKGGGYDDTEGLENVELFGLGVHCLLYGGILSNISGGHDSHLSCYVRRLLFHDGQVNLHL